MPQNQKRHQELLGIYEEGVLIFKSNNLYGIVDTIPTNEDPDFNQDFSFTQFIKQKYNFPNYYPWIEKVIRFFDRYNLNFSLFEMRIYDVDRRKYSIYPAAVFKRTLQEIERLILEPSSIAAYEKNSKNPTLYEEVEFKNDTISQGYSHHKYHDIPALKLLKYLWNDRVFIKPDGSPFPDQGEKLLSFETVMKDLNIKSIDGLRGTVEAINKSSRAKKIGLRIKLPRKKNALRLEVTQATV